jgi:VWFA-related protein
MTMKCPRRFAIRAAQFVAPLSAAIFAGLIAIPPSYCQNKPDTPPPAQQQTPPPESQKPGTISIVTTNVIVPVTVKDKKGNLVADLKKDEFRIFEDSVEQNIVALSTEPMPLSVVVLIDNDLGRKDSDQVEPSLRAIVGGLAVNDEANICRFDQFFHEGPGFTKDQEKIVTLLRRTKLEPHSAAPPPGDPFSGPTINGQPAPGADPLNYPSTRAIKAHPDKALDDAVWSGAQLLKDRSSEKRRKIILLISDGQNGGKKFNTHSYDETRAELLRQGIAVYSIATGSSYFERKLNRLEEYAHDTGGDIYYGAKSTSFENFYSVIAEEARNQYILVYSPQGDRKIDYHTIEVRVRREGLSILTRKGYYGGTFATH